ncbi:MAG: metallopeptidase TldD-related protein [Novosphingobium sp.]|nr:metallopeptidase TldD-related protein [Novosphingobium sp.]
MMSLQAALDKVVDLVRCAGHAGADAADAVITASASDGVQVRLGKLEDIQRSEDAHISLRVFVGKRSASIGSTDLGDAALAELAERAVAMAQAAPEDPYAGLAPEALLMRGPVADLDLVDPDEPSPQALRQSAEEAEQAALDINGISNSEGASASAGRSTFALATSHGFAGAYEATHRSISVTVVAGEGGEKQRDYAWRQARHGADLPTPDYIGRKAAERTIARLGPGRMKSGQMPVVFDPRVGGSLIGHLVSAMAGSAIARRASFLLGKEGEALFAPEVTIVEDPHRRRGLRSRPFDGEGLATSPRRLIDAGRLTGWLMDSASARQLGQLPTGHASRAAGGAPGIAVSNVHLEAGGINPSGLIEDIAEGVYVTELFGQGVNGVTGDYSRGATGFRIVNGEIAGPVAEFTIAGNLLDMFAQLTPANDLEWFRAINVPTLRIDGMTVAGE